MSLRQIWLSTNRSPFGRLVLALLGILVAWELVLDTITYQRLRMDLERDLGTRLVNVTRLIVLGLDPAIVSQFREGDQSLEVYRLFARRLAEQASAAAVERVYVVDAQMRTLVDSQPTSPVGRVRYALLANRREIDHAFGGTAIATPIYRDEEGQLRLSALAPLTANGTVAALVGVDASPAFFTTLSVLWGQMALLGFASVAAVTIAAIIATRQVSRRLERLRTAVSRVREGDFAARVEESGHDDIGALGRDLDGMIASVVHTRDYYETVLGSLDVAVITIDERGDISGANSAAGVLLGVSEKALIGRPALEMLDAHHPLVAFVQEAQRQTSGVHTAEIPLGGGLAGGGRVVTAIASPLDRRGDGAGLALWLSDITEVRRLEQRARRNERLAALGAMAGGLLHEVRNPLASMTVYLDLLRGNVNEGEARDLLERALGDAMRLNAFLQDFQIVAGLRPLRRERVEARAVVTGALVGVKVPPTVRVETPSRASLILDIDRNLIEHAVRNLLQNAIDAVRGPGGVVTVEIESEGATTMIRVHDTGPGIAPAQIEHVFDPMVTTKTSGTGLGLTLVHRIAEAHGGSVELTSRPGAGTAFVLRLPTTPAIPRVQV